MSADSRVVAVQHQAQAREVIPLTTQALLERREIVSRVIEEVMVEGVHYGVIPGTKSLSLLKEGAELLLSTFHIAVEPVVTDMCTPTEVRFQVECRGIHMGTQGYVGSGIGVCSSNEEKYRWRRARSRKEYDNTEPSMRRIKYQRDFEDQQVRQSPWDVFHTIMSMATKRGMVALAKTALAASECLKKAELNKAKGVPPAQPRATTAHSTPPAKTAGTAPSADKPQDQPRPATPAPATPAADAGPVLIATEQINWLMQQIDHVGVPENAFLARFEIGKIKDLEAARFDAAVSWLQANSS